MGRCRPAAPAPPGSSGVPPSSAYSTRRSPAPPTAGRRSCSSAASRASARRGCCASSSRACATGTQSQSRVRATGTQSRVRARDACVLLGQCLELGGAQIPYAPLLAALRPLARGFGAGAREEPDGFPEATRNALADLLPELGGTGTRADAEPSARQGRLFEALLALLERLGRSTPVLLAIEDIHWADGSTRDFITFLVRSAREERLCLVVTYRSDELHRRHPLRPLLAELERAAGVERLALERFDRGEVAEQLEGILQEPAPAALTERLYARSQGNALYTEELLAATEDGDSLAVAGDAARRAPDAVRAAVARRTGGRARRGGARPAGDARAARGRLGPAPAGRDGGSARGGRAPGARDRHRRRLRLSPCARRRGGPRRPAAGRGHGLARPHRRRARGAPGPARSEEH